MPTLFRIRGSVLEAGGIDHTVKVLTEPSQEFPELQGHYLQFLFLSIHSFLPFLPLLLPPTTSPALYSLLKQQIPSLWSPGLPSSLDPIIPVLLVAPP